MKIKQEVFGELNGEKVIRYVLTNSHQTRIAVLSLGGTLQEFVVVENGQERPLTIGLKTLDDYLHNVFNISQSVGRVAGRIGGAQFKLDGQTYHVDMNEQTHSLHGGFHGFTKINYAGQTDQTADTASVTLTHHVKSTDDNYPGNLALKIKFTLDEANQVSLEYGAQTDAPTLFNPTNHVYWNVTDGQTSIDHQWLQINSDQRVETAAEKLPTGKLLPVAGTAYDFQQPRGLKPALAALAAENGKVEFDDAYQVTPSFTAPVAAVGDAAGQRRVDIYSDRNGLVIFTADPVNGKNQDAHRYNSLATEAQTLPDAINHPGFGDITLRPGHPVTRHIMFAYHYLGE
ncbi:galactose mutarotase [Lactiplantibacillus garii]|uniref:Maltose epimerase n=1 Tax=Lactiplantibacillus garii TaxID=2306423 RepID=A0A3R8J4P0_9LACO|nr:aldose epimerase family protein [Lactiplantibacillus garii]RRK09193.1 galactose mutarotase [Lactiplantibacillus garii]